MLAGMTDETANELGLTEAEWRELFRPWYAGEPGPALEREHGLGRGAINRVRVRRGLPAKFDAPGAMRAARWGPRPAAG